LHWLQVVGALGIGLAVFLAARALRPRIDDFPEFDLIVLYSTLVLPMISPFLMVLAGIDPDLPLVVKYQGRWVMLPLSRFASPE